MAGDQLQQAVFLRDAGDLVSARRLLDGILQEDPADGGAIFVRAVIDATEGDVDTARRGLLLVVDTPALRAQAAAVLAQLATRAGDGPGAVHWATVSAQAEPDDPAALGVLAGAFAVNGDKPGAYATSLRGVEAAGNDHDARAKALRRHAELLLQLGGRGREAARAAAEAQSLVPDDTATGFSLAMSQFVAGHRVRAIRTALRVLAQDPTTPLMPRLIDLTLDLLLWSLSGWSALVCFVTGVVFVPLAVAVAPDAPFAIVGVAALVLFVGLWLSKLRDLREPALRRAMWKLARRKPWAWVVGGFAVLVVAADAATVFGTPPVGVVGGMLGFLLLWMIGGHIGRASLARFEREGADDLARAAAARRSGR